MRQLTLVFCIILGLTISIVSCKKDETGNTTKSRKEILATGYWRIVASTKYGENNLDPCETDDWYKFASDGILTQYTGNIPCFPGDTIINHTSWSLSSGGDTIYLNTIPNKIQELTSSKFVISREMFVITLIPK
jgi:hypothetical protein